MNPFRLESDEVERLIDQLKGQGFTVRPTDQEERAYMAKYGELLGGISEPQLLLRCFRAIREMVEAGDDAELPRDVFLIQQGLQFKPSKIGRRFLEAEQPGASSARPNEDESPKKGRKKK